MSPSAFPLLHGVLLSALVACSGGKGDSDSAHPDPTPEDRWNAHGWFQQTGDATGLWIEEEDAVLPETCDGDLEAAGASAGLAYVSVGSNSSGEPFLEEEEVEGWPDGPTPSPIYRASLTGTLTAAESHGYPRSFEVQSANIGSLVYVDVCDTALLRGSCVLPGAGFPFGGCIGTQGQRVSFVITELDFISIEGGYRAETTYGYECDNSNVRLDGHPDDLAYGAQTVMLAVSELPDGLRVALDPADVAWSGSIKAQEDCVYIEDLGNICDCGWAFVDRVDIGEAWALRQGATVSLLLRGQGADAGFFLWGIFDLR